MAVVNTLIGHIKGPKGDTGETGATGATGAAGADATVSVGSTTTVPYGQAARVTNTGTPGAAVFNFTIPQGKPGEQTTKLDALTLDALTEPSTAFPVPAVGDNGSTLFGKISKWFSDMSALVVTKLNVANVVNNLTTTASGYALDARQGKALNDHISNKVSVGLLTQTNTVNAASGTSTVGATLTADTTGAKIIVAYARFQTLSTTGLRRVSIYIGSTEAVNTDIQGNSAAYLRICVPYLAGQLTADTTVTARVLQTTGTTVACDVTLTMMSLTSG